MIDVGSRIRDYEIVARLKAGGMATLFLARRTGAAGFARHVAIKVVHPHLASDPEFVRMFVDEAKLSARIIHPNVVHVEELGHIAEGGPAGTYFLAMEYVHGSALSTLLGALSRLERRLSPEIAVWIAMRVADGLHAAHEVTDDEGRPLGVVHRDVSPQNVLVSSAGHVKLIDFGIAKASSSAKRTETGALKGKIRYMAPEQAYGHAIDRRTDVYALGIVLWEMLTMQRMFRGQNDFALLDEVRNPKIEPPSELAGALPPALDRAVMRALARDPAQRPASAHELKRMLSDAMPSANAVDPAQIAEIVEVILGERIEAKRRELPESLTGLTKGEKPSADRSLHAQDVLRSMTVSSPGAKYQPDGDGSLDVGPQLEARVPIGASASSPGGTPLTASFSIGAPPPSRDRTIAIVAGGVALLALGIAGGVLIGARGNEPTATSLAPTAAAPLPPAQIATPPIAPDAGVAIAAPIAPEIVPPAEPSRSPPRHGTRRPREPADPGVERAVDGVPIYDDEW